MRISLAMIKDKWSSDDSRFYYKDCGTVFYTSIRILNSSINKLENFVIYVQKDDYIPELLDNENSAILFMSSPKESGKCQAAWLEGNIETSKVLNQILEIADYYENMEKRLQAAMNSKHQLQELIYITYKILGNPAYIADNR